MRIIVTGAAGFVGSVMCKRLAAAGHEAVACDNLSFGDMRALGGFNGTFLQKDFWSLSGSELSGAGAILHQAAISDPNFSDEKTIREVNFTKSLELMERAAAAGIRFVYASSSAVYGNTPAPNIEFENELPLNEYGRSKLELDRAARRLIENGEIGGGIIGLRYFNIYGQGEEYKGRCSSMVFHFLKSLMAGRRPIVYGDGSQSRDFVCIEDVVSANVAALESEKSGIANIGSGKSVSFNRLIGIMSDELGKRVECDYVPTPVPQTYQTGTLADLAGARELLGFVPKWAIERGVGNYARYLARVVK